MITLSLLMLALGEPPQGPPVRLTYAEFRAMVERLPPGKTLTLSVGQPGEYRCDDAKTVGIDAGQYSCWYDGGIPRMQRIGVPVQSNVNGVSNVYAPWNSSCPTGNCPQQRR